MKEVNSPLLREEWPIELYKEKGISGAKKTRERFIKRFPYLADRLQGINCYLTHREAFPLRLDDSILNLAQSNDNFFCVLSYANSSITGYPTITGDTAESTSGT